MLTKECSETNHCGCFKKIKNIISTQNKIIYIPPDPEEIEELIDDLIDYFNNNDNILHPFLKSSVIHYYLVNIHPFDNGNGRMASLLQHLFIGKEQYKNEILKIKKPIILMSYGFEFEKSTYTTLENNLHSDTSNNDYWNAWFEFNLDMIETQLINIKADLFPAYDKYDKIMRVETKNKRYVKEFRRMNNESK